KFEASLDGEQQVPSVSSPGTGTGTVLLNEARDQITVNLTFSGLTSNASLAHIHGPANFGANAGILFDFTAVTPAATSGTIPEQTFAITPAQVAQLEAGQLYFNIHTANFGGGEIRGQVLCAPIRKYRASMTGAQEVPPSGSAATGTGTVVLNDFADQIVANGSFSGLSSNSTVAHIHGPAAAGSIGGILFPLDGIGAVTTGILADQLFSISPAQWTQLDGGLHYFNVHSANHGNGEIRGQIGAVPLLTIARGGTGSSSTNVTSSPAGIACGGDCTEAYIVGTTVTLTPGTAAAGSFFAGWTGGGCSGLTCSVALNANTTVTAIYTLSSTPFTFTDDPLVPQQTRVKAVHVNQLRSAVDTLRANNGLGAFTFTDPSLAAGARVKAVHIAELRTALDAVFTQRSRPVPVYTDPTLTATTKVKVLHIAELRSAVRLIE
ncbi:MAG: CHRD domain-containing protein, partial [Thermoanaerobaculia bacterium]